MGKETQVYGIRKYGTRNRTHIQALNSVACLAILSLIGTPCLAASHSFVDARGGGVQGPEGVIPPRVILQLLLESLLDALDEPEEVPPEAQVSNTDSSDDDLDLTAEYFIIRYILDGVDAELTETLVQDALTAAQDAETLIETEDIDLEASLENELLQMLPWLRSDLEELLP